mgnify:FL=1|jgi:hypothetical protein
MTIVAGNESLPKGDESPIHDTVTKNIKEWTGIDNHRYPVGSDFIIHGKGFEG